MADPRAAAIFEQLQKDPKTVLAKAEVRSSARLGHWVGCSTVLPCAEAPERARAERIP